MRSCLSLLACLLAAPALAADQPALPPVAETPLWVEVPSLAAPLPLSGAFAGARAQQITAITLGAVGGTVALIGMFGAPAQTPAQTWGWMSAAGVATIGSVVLFSTTRLTARRLQDPSARHKRRGVTATVVTISGIALFTAGFVALETTDGQDVEDIGVILLGLTGVISGLALFPIGLIASAINTGRILDEANPDNNWGEVSVAPLLLPDGGGLALTGRL